MKANHLVSIGTEPVAVTVMPDSVVKKIDDRLAVMHSRHGPDWVWDALLRRVGRYHPTSNIEQIDPLPLIHTEYGNQR